MLPFNMILLIHKIITLRLASRFASRFALRLASRFASRGPVRLASRFASRLAFREVLCV
jgi:hypothetical protein